MNDQTPSGDRWEPTDPHETAPVEPLPPAPRPTQAPPSRAPGWTRRLRGRAGALAAAGAGLVVVSGLAGFGIGHTVAGNGDEGGNAPGAPGQVQLQRFDHRGPGGGDRFDDGDGSVPPSGEEEGSAT